jgi:predicted alpha/beta-hydrolase family hydrolase
MSGPPAACRFAGTAANAAALVARLVAGGWMVVRLERAWMGRKRTEPPVRRSAPPAQGVLVESVRATMGSVHL